jgi:hypothetical protein
MPVLGMETRDSFASLSVERRVVVGNVAVIECQPPLLLQEFPYGRPASAVDVGETVE